MDLSHTHPNLNNKIQFKVSNKRMKSNKPPQLKHNKDILAGFIWDIKEDICSLKIIVFSYCWTDNFKRTPTANITCSISFQKMQTSR